MVGSVRGNRKRYPESKLHKKLSWADYLLAPEEVTELPQLILREHFVDAGTIKNLGSRATKRKDKNQAFIPVSTGCDNFCAYCVVPYAREEEKSRSLKDIVEEVESLTAQGYRHITLLGQNVNSWGIDDRQRKMRIRTNSNEKLPFAYLLRRLHEIENLEKISFISSNPFDFTMDLVETLALPKIDHYLHLPVQSGDNEILKKMNRRHTVEDLSTLIKNIKRSVPEIEVGTDFLVGFPGETEGQFQNTVMLCQEVKFSVAYISMYSERPGTLAARLYEDNIPREVKKRRHAYLTNIVRGNKPIRK